MAEARIKETEARIAAPDTIYAIRTTKVEPSLLRTSLRRINRLHADAALVLVVEAWPTLSEAFR